MIVEQLEGAIVRGERPTFVVHGPQLRQSRRCHDVGRRREQLVALCRETGIPIIEDNPYGLLRFEVSRCPVFAPSILAT